MQLSEYDVHSHLMPFDAWQTGEELFGMLDKNQHMLDEDFRPFAEDCDLLQGIQIVTSVDDAWGGFATSYLERLRDEYGKGSLWVWGLERGGGDSGVSRSSSSPTPTFNDVIWIIGRHEAREGIRICFRKPQP